MTKLTLSAAILSVTLVFSSCGGGSSILGTLHSISISPSSISGSAQFVATGRSQGTGGKWLCGRFGTAELSLTVMSID